MKNHLYQKVLLISSDVFYEGDPQRSMFVERSSLSHIETKPLSSPPAIENLRGIMSDLMLAASWSKKPTKIDEQEIKDDEEILAESFITTEQRYPTSSLCEIVHEIENFPLSSSQGLSQPITEVEERDTISPFSSGSPIIIHRTILTRQETDRWPQEESILIDEETITTNERENIPTDIRQHDDDWMNSANQRKEIYGEQYRPEREFHNELPQTIEQQFITDDTVDIESKQDDQIITETSQENVKHRGENDQYHIERTWSTEKILEPPSTVRTRS